jgi:hypothetical protein
MRALDQEPRGHASKSLTPRVPKSVDQGAGFSDPHAVTQRLLPAPQVRTLIHLGLRDIRLIRAAVQSACFREASMRSYFSLSSLADHRDLLPSWYHPNARLERINQTATSANI